jgi:signal transduction histidine kinase
MLHEFISSHRSELLSRTTGKGSARRSSSSPTDQPDSGGSLFLTQLAETLRLEATALPFSPTAIGVGAAGHGRELLAKGSTLAGVVHDYTAACQAIMELAVEQGAIISPAECHALIRCLHTAIAEAVTEYGRMKEEEADRRELERRAQLAHELRNLVQTALLSFQVLETGKVPASGSTGRVLGRSLVGIRDLTESIVSDVCLATTTRKREHTALRGFLEEIAVAAALHARYRNVQFTVEPVDPSLAVEVDRQVLAPAVMNLLHNAFRYTHATGRVTLRARAERGRAFVDVEDECGGLGRGEAVPSGSPGGLPGGGRPGLGLGLTLARRAVAANGGEVHSRDLPGKGCVFSVELPLAPSQPHEAAAGAGGGPPESTAFAGHGR